MVPEVFEILEISDNGTIEDFSEGTKAISWSGTWVAGETVTFSYNYDAPNISPEFYTIGPISGQDYDGQTSFVEQRVWQIANDAWYNPSWQYRKKITIDHTKVDNVADPSTTYAEFPVLIYATGLSNINANGTDIRFTTSDGVTELPREIESYSGGTLNAWVNVTLTKDSSDSTDDEIYMYYGNSGASEPAADSTYGSENVWDANYVGVYHLNEYSTAAGGIEDSTSFGHDATLTDADADSGSVAAVIGNGIDFNGDADIITTPVTSGDTQSTATINGWFYADPATSANHRGLMGFRDNSDEDFYLLQLKDSVASGLNLECRVRTATDSIGHNLADKIVGLTWQQMGLKYDGSDRYIMIDGAEDDVKSVTGNFGAGGKAYQIGSSGDGGNTYEGIIDEVRISNIARSTNWIKTLYTNQNAPGSFITLGSEELSASLSGTIYAADGVTPAADGTTVTFLEDGAALGNATVAGGSGAYSSPITALPAAGDVITIFIDDHATGDGVMVTKSDGAADTGFDVYVDHLIVRDEQGSPDIDNADLDTANTGDSDITAIYSDSGGANLTVTSGKELLVWTGDTFTPGGTINAGGTIDVDGTFNINGQTTDIDGDMLIGASGVVSAGAAAISVAGDWSNSGTFTAGTSTVTFDGSANDHDINGTTTFNNLTVAEDDDSDDSVLTFANGTTQSITGTLTLDGVDADDRINLVSDSAGTEATIDFTGSSTFTGDYLDITDNHSADNSSGVSLPITPANSVDRGNSDGWFTQASIAYSGAGFTEDAANDGSVSGSIIATLTGDTFQDSDTDDILDETTELVLANVPAGLTPVINLSAGDTVATLTLTGNATNHLDADDVADITFEFQDGAFTNIADADSVTNATGPASSSLGVDFDDQPSIIYAGNFSEVTANDGSVTGTRTATITNDTFINAGGTLTETTHYTLANKPAGLSAVIIVNGGGTVATLALSGNATNHLDANDVADLTITFLDGAFTNTSTASDVTNYTDNTGQVDFDDQPSIAYSGAGFTEVAANDGSVSGSIIATLTGDTFQDSDTDDVLDETTELVLANVPAGLTPVITLSAGDTVATLTLTGNATNHLDANDVADITFEFQDGAFITIPDADNVTNATGPASSSLGVDFDDQPSIAYSGAGFTEAAANDGSVSGSIIATLTGDTFQDSDVDDILDETTELVLANVPAGLTPVITLSAGDTVATLTLTGNATNHLDADDVADITFEFQDGSFTNTTDADDVTNATGPASSSLGVDFNDQPSIAYSGAGFTEVGANDGSVSGSIIATLTDDTFQDSDTDDILDETTELVLANVPAGLTPVITLSAGDTIATLTLTGNATNHLNADDVADITFEFQDGAFTTTTEADSITNATGPASSSLGVDFNDPVSIVWAGNFTELAANDGSVSGSRTATITGDTFVNAGGTLTETTHFTLANKPAGLTAVMNVNGGGTVATLTFTGNATNHLDADDVANLTITFLDGAFTNTSTASDVTNYTDNTGQVDFDDQPSIAYSGAGFTEVAANDGSVSGSIIATLTGDTFQDSDTDDVLDETTELVLANVPAGLTPVITLSAGDTVATLTFTGNATNHLDANDVADITFEFQDGSFINTTDADDVTNATGPASSSLGVDFDDQPSIAYSGAGFTEAIANDGSVTGSIIATLTGDTFQDSDTDDILDETTEFVLANVPAGLTPVITLSAGDTVATLTLTGNATNHLDADDVADITFEFQDGSFTNTTDADDVTNATGPASSSLGVDFDDPFSISWAGNFTESAANDGSVSGSRTATITGDTFVNAGGTLTESTHFTLANKPAGLTAVMNVNGGGTVATLTFTSNATNHLDADDVANLTVTFLDGAFTTTATASDVTNYTNNTGQVDFNDQPSIAYSGAGFTEGAANDGSVSGSIIATLTGDTFQDSDVDDILDETTELVLANVPAGLTPVITLSAGDTVATLTLTGNATNHLDADDVADITFEFQDGAFTNISTASDVTNATGPASSSLGVDFNDQASIIYAGNFSELAANDGSVSGSRTATITGDTFVNAGGTLTETTHFTLANKPAGLTAIMIVNGGGTVATLTFTGNATNHLDADDVANLTITFLDGAFTNTATASNVTNYTDNTGQVDFNDQPSIAYSGAGFTEVTDNDGSVSGSIIATLTGDTFQDSDTDNILDDTTELVLGNVPAGLTPVITLSAGDTVATLTFTGNATNHLDADDVADITFEFQDGAFINTTDADDVTNATGPASSSLGVDFNDQPSIAYSGAGFTEAPANDGSVSGSIIATLTDDTFQDSDTDDILDETAELVLANVPAGLTPVITLSVGDTVATLTLTGNATNHLDADDVADITFEFQDVAFTTTTEADSITNATGPASSSLGVDFDDQASIAYDIPTFTEDSANDGSIGNNPTTATLIDDTFVGVINLGVHVLVNNVPAGLSASVNRVDGTNVEISLTGNAGSHLDADDIANLEIIWQDGAFTNTTTSSNVTNYSKTDFAVDFAEAPIITWAGDFTEAIDNDGSVTGSRTATLTLDTYLAAVLVGDPFIETTHYTIANVPAGLTAVLTKTSDTLATLTLTGNATNHSDADDVANLTVTFLDGAFTNTAAASDVTNYTDNTGQVDFENPASLGSGSSPLLMLSTPMITSLVPAKEDVLSSLDEISFEALTTAESSFNINVDGEQVPISVTRREDGRYFIIADISLMPFEPGEVEIDLLATNKIGQERRENYTVTIERHEECKTSFEDTLSHWAMDYIERLECMGIVSGRQKGLFVPDDYITHAELTKIAVLTFGISISEVMEQTFPDVKLSTWYASFVDSAYKSGIIQRHNDGLFRPEQGVTRMEALRILMEAAKLSSKAEENLVSNYKRDSSIFFDVSASAWFAKYVAFAKDYNIIVGYKDGTFRPDRYISRAEAAKVTTMLLDIVEQNKTE
ncbi:DUF2341 domain-containing protein [Patescibacteria group bacterium]